MLNLSNSGVEIIPRGVISSLIKLEELYMGNTSIKWAVANQDNQNENASLDELRQLSNLTTLELQIQEAWMLPRDLMFDKLERFKIVIGDIWEWADINDVTLKTLKLKLGTNIHLEHGIKGLIRRAEILGLDEVEGISNVLYQLNGDGFPHLKHLQVQNNAIIKHIIDFAERTHVPDPFASLEKLVIQNLSTMEKICHGPLAIDPFAKLKSIKVESCNKVKYLLSVSMVKGMSQLSELQVSQCSLVEKVVFEDGDASTMKDETDETIKFPLLNSLTLQHLDALESFFSDEQPTSSTPVSLFNNHVTFPNLESLKLSSLGLNKIWKDNRHSFYKLTNLIVENCDGLKYLLSSTMVESFPNLTRLEISKCHLMEEIISAEERDDDDIVTVEELKQIWSRNPDGALMFCNLEEMRIESCQSLEFVFPCSVATSCSLLKELDIKYCGNMKEIVALKEEPLFSMSFQNLKELYVKDCKGMTHLITSFVAKSLVQLERLIVINCEMVKDVVNVEEGKETEEDIIFENLEYLQLSTLSSLRSFCNGNHALIFPSLIRLIVKECPQMEVFSPGSVIARLLRGVELENQRKRWKVDLNTTIQQLFKENQEVSHSNEKN
ncbi:hypothetical protein PIB30_016510 [Stylosanthes scabra]|uniref:Disease resistance protein At4g27190-like leucine-rich repeats domain-containing protein n=1 Tax=Stylosanthes scabra TaxID=79078 RepID=A0ABU6Z4U3_9FABA|nr:hypothetical protein [Stylosanthes scabra]